MQNNFELDSIINESLSGALEDSIVAKSALSDKYSYEGNEFPVDILEFAEGSKYLNLEGSLYKQIKNILIDIEDNSLREIDLTLGKGSGKSQIGKVFSLYGVYWLLRLKNPQAAFSLTHDTQIYCGVVSVSGKQAKDNIFAGVKSLVSNSEFFKNISSPLALEIYFPKNIRYFCGHSNHTAFLGYATFRAVMDEVNFMFDTNNRSVARQLYSALRGSLKTRFPKDYKLLSISSDSLPSSFLRERLVSLKEKIRKQKEFKDGK